MAAHVDNISTLFRIDAENHVQKSVVTVEATCKQTLDATKASLTVVGCSF